VLEGRTMRRVVQLGVAAALLLPISASAQQQAPASAKPKPAAAARKPEDTRLDEILRLNREILEQHRAYERVSDEKIRRLVDLLADYERRWSGDRLSDEVRRAQDRTNRYAAEYEASQRVDSLESQLRRLTEQMRGMESKLQQYEQMLDGKQREIQQLEDRLRMQTPR